MHPDATNWPGNLVVDNPYYPGRPHSWDRLSFCALTSHSRELDSGNWKQQRLADQYPLNTCVDISCSSVYSVPPVIQGITHIAAARQSQASSLVKSCSTLKLSRRHNTHNTCTFRESRPEDPIGILEHPIFQTHNDELTALEPRLDQAPNILSMRQIQSSVHFVKNIHRRRLELQQR